MEEQICHRLPQEQCEDVSTRKCSTPYMKECSTSYEKKCHPVTTEECKTVHYKEQCQSIIKDMTEVAAPIQKAMEIAPLDALYPTIRVSSKDEKQQTLHRLSPMHESTYQEDMKNKTYQENRSCIKNVEGEIAPLDALYPMLRVSFDDGKQHTHHRMPAVHESTYLEDMQNKAYQEDGSRAKNVMTIALHHPKDHQNRTTSPACPAISPQ